MTDSYIQVPNDGAGKKLRTLLSIEGEHVQYVADDFATHEPLAEQAGAGAVLTFDFSAPVQMACVESFGDGLVSRAHASGTPTAVLGTPCRHEVPTYLTVVTAQVKVFAPAGTMVSCWGFRR